MPKPSPNFIFLNEHDATLVVLGTLAESYFRDDPGTSLFKLRQFGELLAKHAWARLGTYTRDELIDCIPSVLRKDQTLYREDLMRALLHHLGFQRLTDAAQDALKSAFNGAVRRGLRETVDPTLVRRMS